MIGLSCASIWQPLHTPSENVSSRAKNAANASRSALRSRIDGGPAAAGAEHVAVAEAAAGGEALEVVERDAAGDQVAHVHVERLEAGAVERGRHLDLAVDALLAQDRDLRRADARVDVTARRCLAADRMPASASVPER